MELANEVNCQVILTTHSPGFASDLPMEGIRYITVNKNSKHEIQSGVDVLNEVAEALGITPDSRVKALVCVEGPTDVNALKALSEILYFENNNLPNLATDDRVAFIVLGGGNLKHWVNNNYLKGLGKPEFHIYDADVPSYSESANEVNQRGDGSRGFITEVSPFLSVLATYLGKFSYTE